MTDPDDPADPPPPDLDALAKRYLDMWQAQLTTMSGDAETAKALASTMAMMSADAQSFANAARNASTNATATADDGGSGGGDAGGAAQAADAAPGGAGAAIDQLARRLADAEQRITRLESELWRLGEKADGRDRQDDP